MAEDLSAPRTANDSSCCRSVTTCARRSPRSRGYSEAIVEGAVTDLPRRAARRSSLPRPTRLERLIDDPVGPGAPSCPKRFSFNLSSFALDECVRTATEALLLRIIASDVVLDIDVPSDPVEVIGDPHRTSDRSPPASSRTRCKYADSHVRILGRARRGRHGAHRGRRRRARHRTR